MPNWNADKSLLGMHYISPLFNFFWDLPKFEPPVDAFEYQVWYSSAPIVLVLEIMFFIFIPHLVFFFLKSCHIRYYISCDVIFSMTCACNLQTAHERFSFSSRRGRKRSGAGPGGSGVGMFFWRLSGTRFTALRSMSPRTCSRTRGSWMSLFGHT